MSTLWIQNEVPAHGLLNVRRGVALSRFCGSQVACWFPSQTFNENTLPISRQMRLLNIEIGESMFTLKSRKLF